jgi:hypothetical protein
MSMTPTQMSSDSQSLDGGPSEGGAGFDGFMRRGGAARLRRNVTILSILHRLPLIPRLLQIPHLLKIPSPPGRCKAQRYLGSARRMVTCHSPSICDL